MTRRNLLIVACQSLRLGRLDHGSGTLCVGLDIHGLHSFVSKSHCGHNDIVVAQGRVRDRNAVLREKEAIQIFLRVMSVQVCSNKKTRHKGGSLSWDKMPAYSAASASASSCARAGARRRRLGFSSTSTSASSDSVVDASASSEGLSSTLRRRRVGFSSPSSA